MTLIILNPDCHLIAYYVDRAIILAFQATAIVFLIQFCFTSDSFILWQVMNLDCSLSINWILKQCHSPIPVTKSLVSLCPPFF